MVLCLTKFLLQLAKVITPPPALVSQKPFTQFLEDLDAHLCQPSYTPVFLTSPLADLRKGGTTPS